LPEKNSVIFIFSAKIVSLLQGFPLGERLLAKQGGEGRRSFLIYLNIFNKRFLKIKGRNLFSYTNNFNAAFT